MKFRRQATLRTLAIALAVLIALGGLFATVARADIFVVPARLTRTEGGGSGAPFSFQPNALNPSRRYQQVYAASEFLSPGGAQSITRIAFRPNSFNLFTSSTIDDIQISLSTTNVGPGPLGAPGSLGTYGAPAETLDNNLGADNTIVYSGPLTLSTANTGPPGEAKNFDIIVDLQTPFQYDPEQGNLLLEIRFSARVLSPLLDAEDRINSPTSAVSVNNGRVVGASAVVTQFTTSGSNIVFLTPGIFGGVPNPDANRGAIRFARIIQIGDTSGGLDPDPNTQVTIPVNGLLNYVFVYELITGSAVREQPFFSGVYRVEYLDENNVPVVTVPNSVNFTQNPVFTAGVQVPGQPLNPGTERGALGIQGVVVNNGGAPIAGADVTLFTTAGEQVAQVKTNGNGFYSFYYTSGANKDFVRAGDYIITAAKSLSANPGGGTGPGPTPGVIAAGGNALAVVTVGSKLVSHSFVDSPSISGVAFAQRPVSYRPVNTEDASRPDYFIDGAQVQVPNLVLRP